MVSQVFPVETYDMLGYDTAMVRRLCIIGAIILAAVAGLSVVCAVYILHIARSFGIQWSLIPTIVSHPSTLLVQDNAKTNILILGIAGGDHEGKNLTDSMTLFSLGATASESARVSIPRDMWSDTLQDKVNSAFYYGELMELGSGLQLTRGVVGGILGIPVHYALTVDFSQFSEIIDAVGGIRVEVGTSFTDTKYPIAGKENDECEGDPTYSCRYQTVVFTQGKEIMDGSRALEYVRSRHSDGDTGTDFSRGIRQQEVISALVGQLKHPASWFRFITGGQVLDIARSFIQGDMRAEEIAAVGVWIARNGYANIRVVTVEDMLKVSEDFQQRYILLPKMTKIQFQKELQQRLFLK